MNIPAKAGAVPDLDRWPKIRCEMWLRIVRNACRVLSGLLLLVLPGMAQMQIGDNLRMNLNGDVGFVYNGGLNQGLSGHSMGFSGDGALTGNYYSPNFLNFNVNPFYNRSQSNSVSGSLTNTSGVTSSVNLFSGSHFPGTVSYNELHNATGQFGVPGSELGLEQSGNTQGYAIGWSALVPDWPTLIANYSVSHQTTSIIGVDGHNAASDHTLNIQSNYTLDGWRMMGQFIHRNTNADFSEIIDGLLPVKTSSSSDDIGGSVQHALPLAGSFSTSWNHLAYDYAYHDSYASSNSGASTTLNSNATFHPTRKLGVALNANYNDSLLGTVPEGLLSNGVALNMRSAGTFRSTLVGTDVYYQVFKNFGVHGDVTHTSQSFLGQNYSATQFFGSANFSFDHSLLKGLSFSLGVVDTAQQTENTGLGYVANLNYTRRFSGWELNANFSYTQNVQTALLVYTTSCFSYLGSIRRRITERTYFMAGYSGAHSGITANSGTNSDAERVWTTFMHRGYSLNAFFNKSRGMALLGQNGLVTIPGNLPPPVLGNEFTSYDSTGWGLNASGTVMRRLILNAGFSKSNGHTIDPLLTTATNTELINATGQYRIRKIFLNAGYTRLRQSVGMPGTQPIDVTTYFIGFSRWFNFF